MPVELNGFYFLMFRATQIADKLNVDFALVHKDRRNVDPLHPSVMLDDMILVGDVKDKVCIIIDDIADTCSTLIKASQVLKENGSTKIFAFIT
jgi:ribose-phosphate pyrophosphokinase